MQKSPTEGPSGPSAAPGDRETPLWARLIIYCIALGPFKSSCLQMPLGTPCIPTACVPETWGCTLTSPLGQLCCYPPAVLCGCKLILRLPHCPCLTRGAGGSRPLRPTPGERRFQRAGSAPGWQPRMVAMPQGALPPENASLGRSRLHPAEGLFLQCAAAPA